MCVDAKQAMSDGTFIHTHIPDYVHNFNYIKGFVVIHQAFEKKLEIILITALCV